MALIHKIIRWGSDFFSSFKSENKKQLIELAKLEKKIEEMKHKERTSSSSHMNFDTSTFLKFWLMWFFVAFVAYISYQSSNVIFLIITAFIVSLAIEAIITIFQKRITYRGLSIALAYFLLIVLILWSLIYIIPFLLTQIADVISILTSHITEFKSLLETKSLTSIIQDIHRLPRALKEWLLDAMMDPTLGTSVQTKLQENVSYMVNLWSTYAKDIGNFAVNFVWGFVSLFTELSIVLTLSVLFSIQKSAVMNFISGLWWEDKYQSIYMKLERIYKKLGIWLKSQFLLCLFIGGTMLVSFWILALFGMNLPSKMSLALIGALTEVVPYFWPFLWWWVAILVAFIHFGWRWALVVTAVIFVIQWLENNIFIPLLMNKTLGINPVVIFISIILGSFIIGFVWLLLAVPISVIITMVLDKKFEEE